MITYLVSHTLWTACDREFVLVSRAEVSAFDALECLRKFAPAEHVSFERAPSLDQLPYTIAYVSNLGHIFFLTTSVQ